MTSENAVAVPPSVRMFVILAAAALAAVVVSLTGYPEFAADCAAGGLVVGAGVLVWEWATGRWGAR